MKLTTGLMAPAVAEAVKQTLTGATAVLVVPQPTITLADLMAALTAGAAA